MQFDRFQVRWCVANFDTCMLSISTDAGPRLVYHVTRVISLHVLTMLVVRLIRNVSDVCLAHDFINHAMCSREDVGATLKYA